MKLNSLEIDVNLLKIFEFYKIDYNDVKFPQWNKFLKSMNPHYSIPSPEKLNSDVFTTTYASIISEVFNSNPLDIIILATSQNDSVFKICSFLYSLTEKLTFLKIQNFKTTNPSISSQISDFCDASVQKASEVFNVNVRYLLYDFDVSIDTNKEVEGKMTFRIPSFSLLINTIINDPNEYDITTSEIENLQSFKKHLENLEIHFNNNKCTMAEAVQSLLQFHGEIKSLIPRGKLEYIRNFMGFFMKEIPVVCNFYDHRFRAELCKTYPILRQKLTKFWESDYFRDSLLQNSDYMDKSGIFFEFFSSKKSEECDAKTFWLIHKGHGGPLINIALNLVSIPAKIPKITPKIFELDCSIDYEKLLIQSCLILENNSVISN